MITQTLPKRQGQRNDCIMSLARGLKFDAGLGDATFAQLKPLIRRWHQSALPVIGTKDFDETWVDFIRAFLATQYPLQWKADVWALTQAKRWAYRTTRRCAGCKCSAPTVCAKSWSGATSTGQPVTAASMVKRLKRRLDSRRTVVHT